MENRYKVRLNSADKVEELLQEIYDQAAKQIREIEIEMGKLSKFQLADADIDSLAKYSKATHDLIGDKNKAIGMKFEIAKFMGEILKHNGDANAALNDQQFSQKTKLDLKGIREAMASGEKNYDLK